MTNEKFESVFDAQRKLCSSHGAAFLSTGIKSKLGISQEALRGSLPMHGLRHPPTGDTCGWYIWSGSYSEDSDFFQPLHVEHALLEQAPFVHHLGLAPGWRFLIGENGYEDVWFDQTLLTES